MLRAPAFAGHHLQAAHTGELGHFVGRSHFASLKPMKARVLTPTSDM